MGIVRRISALVLVVALSLVGIPLPAQAEEERPAITLNGRPLSELLRPRVSDPAHPLPALVQQGEGLISGVLLGQDGEALAGQRVELDRPASEGPGRPVATTGANGEFIFRSLGPGQYEVLYVADGDVVSRSNTVELTRGTWRRLRSRSLQPEPVLLRVG